MNESNQRAQLIGVLAEAFRQKITPTTIQAYEFGLSDIPPSAVEVAIKRAIQTSRFMPTAAELREACGQIRPDDRAVIAWGTVERCVGLGPYKHVDFEDGIINATIRTLGGWPNFIIRFSSAEAEKWLMKEFEQTYRALARSRVDGEVCRPLPGLSEKTAVNGKLVDPIPVRIRCDLPAHDSPRIGGPSQAPHRLMGPSDGKVSSVTFPH